MRSICIIIFCVASLVVQSSNKPNIVLILIDDLGLTDLQAFGGEINTPNMDALAAEGMIFSNYHTTPECAPSRAMLLTGMDNHNTGIPMIPEVLPWEYRNTPGYEGYLRDDALTIAEILKPAGYRSYMTGKWHLAFGGDETAALPFNRGFDKTFILDATGGNNFSHHSYLPYYLESPWFKNGKETELPEDFYSSEFFVDQMIEFIEEDKDTDSPFIKNPNPPEVKKNKKTSKTKKINVKIDFNGIKDRILEIPIKESIVDNSFSFSEIFSLQASTKLFAPLISVLKLSPIAKTFSFELKHILYISLYGFPK